MFFFLTKEESKFKQLLNKSLNKNLTSNIIECDYIIYSKVIVG